MQCPKCGHEPGPNDLLASPCPACRWMWVDTLQYVRRLAEPLQPIASVLDIGCGKKGIIGQYVWEQVWPIQRGYACDIHVLKELPPLWTPLLMDAEGLLKRLGPKSVDFVTHCGFLEHVEYRKALRILRVIEQIARKGVFFTCSAILREVDFKCKQDGNPHHAYRSWWDAATFEALGYHVDRDRMRGCGGPSGKESTFLQETTCWYYPDDITESWEWRESRAIENLCERRCYTADCPNEPMLWDAREDHYCCIDHVHEPHDKPDGYEPTKKKGPISRWRDREDFVETFPHPPWREKWQCKERGA